MPRRPSSPKARPSPQNAGECGRRALPHKRVRRKGAVFSIEMMMVITVLIPLMFGLTEFSLLWSANHLLEAAAFEAARAASLPASDDDRCEAAEEAVRRVIVRQRLQDPAIDDMHCDVGSMADPYVTIRLSIPMTAASPDLLGLIGISIKDGFLTAEAVAYRQN